MDEVSARLEDAYARLSQQNVKVSADRLRKEARTGTDAAYAFMRAKKREAGELSPGARKRLEDIRKRTVQRGGNSDDWEYDPYGFAGAQLGDSFASPVERDRRASDAPGDADNTDGGSVGQAGGRRGTDRVLHRRRTKPGGSGDQTDRSVDPAASGAEADRSGDARSVGQQILGSAAAAIKKTKENLAARKEERPPVVKRPLTPSEADELRPVYEQALSGIFDFSDKIIEATNGQHQPVEIWSTIDEADIKKLADARLALAQRSVRAAEGVRRTVWAWQHAATLAILGPRFLQTWQVYSMYGFDSPVKLRKPPASKLKVVK